MPKIYNLSKSARLNKLDLLLKIFVVVVVVLALFFEGGGINLVTEWFTKVFISLVESILVSAFLGAIFGSIFKGSNYNYELMGIEFNVPLTVLTFLVKFILF